MRQGFIRLAGTKLVSIDYSQIELRIWRTSHRTKPCWKLSDRQDIHAATAAAIYNIPLEKVDKSQRRHAKAINFGLIYG